MNAVLESILSTATVRDGANLLTLNHPDFPALQSHIDPAEGAFLQSLIAEVRPRTSLEIGMAYGVSTLFICEALDRLQHRARHIVMDPNQRSQWKGIGLQNAERAGYGSLLEFHEQPSEVVLPQLLARGTVLDFAFVDGWHTFDQVMVEFYYINRLLVPGGVVVFDDANRRSVGRVVRHALTYPCYEVHAASGAPPPARSWKAAARRRLASMSIARRWLRRDVLIRDWDLGIGGRSVALRKTADDTRHTYFDAEF